MKIQLAGSEYQGDDREWVSVSVSSGTGSAS